MIQLFFIFSSGNQCSMLTRNGLSIHGIIILTRNRTSVTNKNFSDFMADLLLSFIIDVLTATLFPVTFVTLFNNYSPKAK